MHDLGNLWSAARGARRAAGFVLALILACCGSAHAGTSTPAQDDSLTSSNMVQKMSPGINLGNTLEAIGGSVTPPATNSLAEGPAAATRRADHGRGRGRFRP